MWSQLCKSCFTLAAKVACSKDILHQFRLSPGLKHQLLSNSRLAGLSVSVCTASDFSPGATFSQWAESLQNSQNSIIATVMVTREIGAAGTACRVMPAGRGVK